MPNRIVKETVWTSESLSELSFGAQMFFFRLLPVPDDHGCFDARVKVLRGKVFPYMLDKVRDGDIEKWLKELQSVDCIRIWVHTNGNAYGLFPKWSEHQVIRSLHKRKTPEPPKNLLSQDNPVTHLKTTLGNSCMQVNADECLNPNPNPNPNPKNTLCKFYEFDTAWAEYPNRIGKKQAERHYKAAIKTQEDHDRLMIAMRRYVEFVNTENAQRNGDPRPWQNGATWFNNWQDWVDYKPPPGLESEDDKRQREIKELSAI